MDDDCPDLVYTTQVPLEGPVKHRLLYWMSGDLNNRLSGAPQFLERFAQTLTRFEDLELHVLSQYPLDKRNDLSDDVASHPRIRFFTPDQFKQKSIDGTKLLLKIMKELDASYHYQHIFVRSLELSRDKKFFRQFPNRLHVYLSGEYLEDVTFSEKEHLEYLYKQVKTFWCSSPAVKEQLVEELGTDNKVCCFRPMFEDVQHLADVPAIVNKIRVCYFGEVSDQYLVVEMVREFTRATELLKDPDFHIYGSFVGEEGDKNRFLELVKNTPGVEYYEVSSKTMEQIMAEYHVGLFFPNKNLETGLNLPESILNYARMGLPCLVAKTKAAGLFYGKDYNGFVTSVEDIPSKLFFYRRNKKVYAQDQRRSLHAAESYTFDSQFEELEHLF